MRNRWYSPELGRFVSTDPMGYQDGPSLYAFAGDDPLNMTDSLGLKREELPPQNKVERKIQQRYQAAYEQFRATPSGREIARRIEEDPNFLLRVRYDANYHMGLILQPEQFDEDGTTTAATLRVGRKFPGAPSSREDYPFGSELTDRKEIGVYTVAHEEGGHFLTAVDDPDYNRRKREAAHAMRRIRQLREDIRTRLGQELAALELPERKRRKARRQLPLRVEEELGQLAEVRELQETINATALYVENTADAVGAKVTTQFRQGQQGKRNVD